MDTYRRERSSTPFLVFIGIVAMTTAFSVVFFFLQKRQKARLEAAEAAATASAASSGVVSAEAAPAAAQVPALSPSVGAEAPMLAPGMKWADPQGLSSAFTSALASGKWDAASETFTPVVKASAQAAYLKALLVGEAPGAGGPMKLAPGALPTPMGEIGDSYRFSLALAPRNAAADASSTVPATGEPPVVPSGQTLQPPPMKNGVPIPPSERLAANVPSPSQSGIISGPASEPVEIASPSAAPSAPPLGLAEGVSVVSEAQPQFEFDVSRDVQKGWAISALRFPPSLQDTVAQSGGSLPLPPAEVAAAMASQDKDDPMVISERFMKNLFSQDFRQARAFTNLDKVGHEKVAGLCILFEEGQYRLAPERPITVTATTPDSSWVLVKVQSDRDRTTSQFGLQLQKKEASEWEVAGIDFSALLQKYMTEAGASAGVAYTPIVKSPNGGEKLVVYFDFNNSEIVPRAQRQLEIVARILKSDAGKKIRLSGHTDALGSDEYNLRLSKARAYHVERTLSSLGVNPAQVVTQGLGKLEPMDPNLKPDGSDNAEGRSRNRRTEIFLDF